MFNQVEDGKSKGPIRVFLALIFLLVIMGVGERLGFVAGFLGLAAWSLTLQFLRSRGDIDAHRHWSRLALVSALPIVVVVVMVLAERRAVILVQAPGILIAGVGGAYAGAFAAATLARRAAARKELLTRLAPVT
jgi:cytochrome c oxidase subunit IV